jgi:hypothetical protein
VGWVAALFLPRTPQSAMTAEGPKA